MFPTPQAPQPSSERFPRLFSLALIAFPAMALLSWTPAAHGVNIPWDLPQTVDASVQDLEVLVAADLDRDGADDLAGAGPGGLAWWSDAQTFAAVDNGATDLAALKAVDLDGDGDPDLVGASPTAGLQWWENTLGDASAWSSAQAIAAGLDARDLAVFDLDEDGDLDLVAALGGASGSVERFLNTSGDASTWSRTAIDAAVADASSVAVGDLDRDGDPDVAATAQGSADRLDWWENTAGDGTAWTKRAVSGSLADPHGVGVADLDGDGDPDLFAAVDGGLVTRLSDGSPADGGWTTGTLAASSPDDPIARDLDLDGDPDLLAAVGNAVLWWDNDGGGSFTPRSGPAAAGARAAVALHLDDDGDLDLAAAAQTDDDLLAWSAETLHRNAVFRRFELDSNFDGARSAHAADLDGDGDLDVVAAAFDQGEVAWWENTGDDPTAWIRRTIDDTLPYAFAVRSADLDDDGDLDLVAAISRLNFATGTNRVYGWRNGGPARGDGPITWTRFEIASPFGASDVWPVDMDRDGDLDIVTAAAGADELAWYANDGSAGGWTETVVDTLFDRVHSVVPADIDGDGDVDLVAAGDTADEVAWWENTTGDGSLPFTKHSIVTDWDGAYDAWVDDLDGDGDLDVLAASEFEDRISWWENVDGDGTFGAENTLGNPVLAAEGFFNQAFAVETGDLDGDGHVDIVGAAFKDGGQVAWWSNVNGDGDTWQKRNISLTEDGAGTAHLADLNGDGLLDLLGTAQTDDRLLLWLNGGGQFALSTVSIAPAAADPSTSYGIFDLGMTHNGQAGEGDIELVSLDLRLEDALGDPLSAGEADGIIERLRILRDDEVGGIPGALDPADTEIAVVETLNPDAQGRLEVPVPDDTAEAAVSVGSPGRFFLEMETTADADAQGVAGLQIVHLTAATSRAEDLDHDIPLRLEYAANTTAGPIGLADTADLEVELVASSDPDPVSAGGTLQWTVTVTNLGPDPVSTASLTLTLEGQATLVSTSGCAEDPMGLPTCTLGALAVDGSTLVTVSVQIDEDAGGSVELTAVVAAAVVDPSAANDQATSSVAVIADADLGVTLIGPTAYTAGNAFSYRVVVTNDGPGPTDAVVAAALPAELDSASWVCTSTGGAACGVAMGSGGIGDSPELPAGGRVEYTVDAVVLGGTTGPVELEASVATGPAAADDDPSDNSATWTSTNASGSIFLEGFETGDLTRWNASVP